VQTLKQSPQKTKKVTINITIEDKNQLMILAAESKFEKKSSDYRTSPSREVNWHL